MPRCRTKTTKNIIFDTESLFDVKNQMKNIVLCAMPKWHKNFHIPQKTFINNHKYYFFKNS
jgi:hypothetical protein